MSNRKSNETKADLEQTLYQRHLHLLSSLLVDQSQQTMCLCRLRNISSIRAVVDQTTRRISSSLRSLSFSFDSQSDPHFLAPLDHGFLHSSKFFLPILGLEPLPLVDGRLSEVGFEKERMKLESEVERWIVRFADFIRTSKGKTGSRTQVFI